MAKDDGYKMVLGRKGQHKTLVPCGKQGCTGTCPLSVVRRSNQKDGIPAKCLVCDRKYKLPPGSAAKPQAPEAGQGSGIKKELEALKKELEALKAAKPAGEAPAGKPQPAAEATPLSDTDKAAANALHKQMQQLKELGPELRAALCEAKGGYDTFLASLEAQRQAIFAKHRGSLPIIVQKQKAEQFLKSVQKSRDDAEAALTELQRQSKELEDKVARQVHSLAEAEAKLQTATAEVASITQAAAQQQAAAGDLQPPPSQQQASALTAHAVRGFFQTLPAQVAEHPEGVEAVQTVMALLEKLDSAAKTAGSEAASSAQQTEPEAQQAGAEASPPDMQVDDATLEFMAEAAVPPAGSEEGAEEVRKGRVAEARDRLKAKKGELEAGLAKVRKTGKRGV